MGTFDSMAKSVSLIYRTDVHSITVDTDDDFDLFTSVVFSLTGVPAAEQVLVLDGLGRATSLEQLPPQCEVALIRCELVARAGERRAAASQRRGRASASDRDLVSQTCSRVFSPFDAIAQPVTRAPSGHLLCLGCAATCVLPGSTLPAPGVRIATCQCLERPGGSCLFESRIGVVDETIEAQAAALGALREMQLELDAGSGVQEAVVGACRGSPGAAAGIQGMAQRLVGMTR